jgi:hypothetical protein
MDEELHVLDESKETPLQQSKQEVEDKKKAGEKIEDPSP